MPKSLIVLSHALQAKRLFGWVNQGRDPLRLVGKSSMAILSWRGSALDSVYWGKLAQALGVSQIESIKLPPWPNSHIPGRNGYYRRLYRKLLADDSLGQLVVFSYTDHYVTLAQTARSKGLKLALVEDGLRTFRGLLTAEENSVRLGKPFPSSNGGGLLLSEQKIDSSLWDGAIGLNRPKSSVAGELQFTDFDFILTAFPNLLESVFPTAQIIEAPHYAPIPRSKECRAVESLFVAQAYSLSSNDVALLLQRALDFANGEILIALHPRSSSRLISAFHKGVKSLGTDQLKFVPMGTDAKRLILERGFENVFSISSTVLIEAKLWDNGIKAVSIGDTYLKRIAAKGFIQDRNAFLDVAALKKVDQRAEQRLIDTWL